MTCKLIAELHRPAMVAELEAQQLVAESRAVQVPMTLDAAKGVILDAGLLAGIHNLDPVITIDGVEVEPSWRYKAQDAGPEGLPAWGYGEDLEAAGEGGDFGLPGPLPGPRDAAMHPRGTRWYQGSADQGNIGERNLIIEALVRVGPSASGSQGVVGKSASGNAPFWWVVQPNNSTACTLQLNSSGGGQASLNVTAAEGQWLLLHYVANLGGGAASYGNARAGTGAADVSHHRGQLDNAGRFTVCTYRDPPTPGAIYDGEWAYIAGWEPEAMSTHQLTDLVIERFAALLRFGL